MGVLVSQDFSADFFIQIFVPLWAHSPFLFFHSSDATIICRIHAWQVTLVVAGAALLLVAIPPLLVAIECVRFSALPLFVFRAQSQLHGANAAFFRKLFEWLEREGSDEADADADADADIDADSDDHKTSSMSSSSLGAAAADPSGSGCLDCVRRRVCGSCCRHRDSDLNSDRGKAPDVAAGRVAPITPREFLGVAPAATSDSAASSAPAAASASTSTIPLPPASESLSTRAKGAGLASKLRALSRFCAVSFIERLIQNYAPHLTAQAYWYISACSFFARVSQFSAFKFQRFLVSCSALMYLALIDSCND